MVAANLLYCLFAHYELSVVLRDIGLAESWYGPVAFQCVNIDFRLCIIIICCTFISLSFRTFAVVAFWSDFDWMLQVVCVFLSAVGASLYMFPCFVI